VAVRVALELQLAHIRDGRFTDAELAEARAAVAADARIPPEIAVDALDDDPPAAAGALLALLGQDDGLGAVIAAAIRAEADAARTEAPPLSDRDRDDLSRPWPVPLAAAVHASAGDAPEVWPAVAAAIGVTAWPIGDAVRAAAGPVPQVWPAVAAAIRETAAPMPSSLGVEPPSIAPANAAGGWMRGWALAAAAVALGVLVWRPLASPEPSEPGSVAVAEVVPALVFASAQETQVVDLSYDAKVNVVQVEGDEGALILWVDDAQEGT
jgi:hypothetical protein